LAAESCRKEIMERVNVRLLQLEANRLVSEERAPCTINFQEVDECLG
jgi:aromatic ring-cleaving dioxygenase